MQKIIKLLSFFVLSSSLTAQKVNNESIATEETLHTASQQQCNQNLSTEIMDQLYAIQELINEKNNELALQKLDELNKSYPHLKLFYLYLSLADSFDDKGDWKNAIKAYDSYLAYILNLNNIPIEEYWNIAWAYYMTGKVEKALEMSFKFAKVYPNNVLHNLNLALYNLILGCEMEAIYLYMWSFSVTLDPSFLYWIALKDIQKSKNIPFYAYAKKRLMKVYDQIKTLEFVQENL